MGLISVQQNNIISIRATQNGVSIICDDQAPISDLVDALRIRLQSHARFYKDADVKLDIGNRAPVSVDLMPIRMMLEEEFQLRLSGIVCSPDALVQQAMQELGCRIDLQTDPANDKAPAPAPSPAPAQTGPVEEKRRSDSGDDTLIVRQTCRSGTTVTSAGSIVIIGNVNPGAEVIAQQDIIVVGILRGNAHAGAGGNTSAIIMALALEPKQLRIASHLGLPPASDEPVNRSKYTPEVAYVDDKQIVIEPYTGRLPVT